jgi:surface antigen
MTKNSALVMLLTAAAAAFAYQANLHAAGTAFLKDTALAFLTEEDRRLHLAAALDVLEGSDPDGSKEWRNPATGASGKSRSLGNLKSSEGLHCRKLKLTVDAKGITTEFAFPACKGNDGEWFIASGKTLHKD